MLNTTTILSQETLIFKGVEAINKLNEMGITYEILANATSNGYKMKGKNQNMHLQYVAHFLFGKIL